MRTSNITREQALALLREYNKEGFHIQHGLTVEGVMCWYANELGYGSFQCEKEIQGQAFCSRMLQRCDPQRR